MKRIIFFLFFVSVFFFCSAQKTEKLVVYFKFNDYTLDNLSKSRIDSVIQNVVVLEVQIEAHCDSIGSNKYNDTLSLKRAMEVKQYLVSKNLNEDLISIKASGKKFPLNKNETEEARALNRRAEIIFVMAVATPDTVMKEAVVVTPKDTVVISNPVHVDEKPKDIEELNIDNVEVGSTFRLSNLNFVGGRHRLLPQSEKTLELLLNIMKTNPNLRIEIQGYVCCTDENSDGLDWETGTYDLSTNRAKAIYEYLIKKGIDRRRLYYIGFGGSHKLVIEKTEADRTINRRVEIKILKK